MTRASLIIALTAAAVLQSAWAYRVLEQHEGAYELVLGEVILPGSEAGSVIFRACADCRTEALRVTAQTTYFVNGSYVDFATFVRAAEDIRQSVGGGRNTAVYVFYDLESKRVNRLKLDQLAGA